MSSSSSSSPSMPSVHQETVSQLQQKGLYDYRQTMYRDGAGLQIAESRRHSGVVRKVGSSTQAYSDFVLFPTDNISLSLRGFSGEALHQHPAPRRGTADPVSELHVTSAKHLAKARPKPVIVQQASKLSRALSDRTKTSFQASSDLKCPSTPRSARLSTPELSDLDEALLCDCDVAGHIVKCYIACGREFNLW